MLRISPAHEQGVGGGGVVFGSARAALPRVCLKWRRVKLSLQAACVSRKLRMARARCAVVACSF